MLLLALFWLVFGPRGGPKSYSQCNETYVFVAHLEVQFSVPRARNGIFGGPSLAQGINFSDLKRDPRPPGDHQNMFCRCPKTSKINDFWHPQKVCLALQIICFPQLSPFSKLHFFGAHFWCLGARNWSPGVPPMAPGKFIFSPNGTFSGTQNLTEIWFSSF